MDAFADIFSSVVPHVEEIHINEDEEYKRYTLRLYERLHRIEEVSTRATAEEAIEANSESSSITLISLSDDSLSEVVIDKEDIKIYHPIEFVF
jgi:hypothetical protein